MQFELVLEFSEVYSDIFKLFICHVCLAFAKMQNQIQMKFNTELNLQQQL